MRIFYFSYYIFLSHAAEEALLCTASLKHQSAELFASPPTKKTQKKNTDSALLITELARL